MTCPCKGCIDRQNACHDNCQKYKEWKSEIDKKKNIIREKQSEINLTRSHVRQRLEEQKRRHR